MESSEKVALARNKMYANSAIVITEKMLNTTANGGSLGSQVDEERS